MINLDSNNRPATHWACYVDSFYFDPFGLPPPENILFIKRYNTLQYQKKDVCSLWLLLSFFFITKFQDGNSIYNILYKILDPFGEKEAQNLIVKPIIGTKYQLGLGKKKKKKKEKEKKKN